MNLLRQCVASGPDSDESRGDLGDKCARRAAFNHRQGLPERALRRPFPGLVPLQGSRGTFAA